MKNQPATALEKALEVAYQAHQGQRSFAGRPYIFHPIRVMEQMDTDEERIVALLHDTVEDTYVTLDHLADWFSSTVVEAVDALTHRDGVPYLEYIEKQVALNPLATKVKLADLQDNMRVDRLPKVTAGSAKRLIQYGQAVQILKRRQHELR